jgi:hypothetical protein
MARSVPLAITVIVLPGVCPGACMTLIPGSTAPSADQVVNLSATGSSACFCSVANSTGTPLTASDGPSIQYSQSRWSHRYVALAKTAFPASVAQPVWSRCR